MPLQRALTTLKTRIISALGPNRIRDYGQENKYAIPPGTVRACHIQFFGSHNQLSFGAGCVLRGMKITILGSHNRLIIENRVEIEKGLIWFAADTGKSRSAPPRRLPKRAS